MHGLAGSRSVDVQPRVTAGITAMLLRLAKLHERHLWAVYAKYNLQAGRLTYW